MLSHVGFGHYTKFAQREGVREGAAIILIFAFLAGTEPALGSSNNTASVAGTNAHSPAVLYEEDLINGRHATVYANSIARLMWKDAAGRSMVMFRAFPTANQYDNISPKNAVLDRETAIISIAQRSQSRCICAEPGYDIFQFREALIVNEDAFRANRSFRVTVREHLP